MYSQKNAQPSNHYGNASSNAKAPANCTNHMMANHNTLWCEI
jgi:hypothetical protein